MGEATHMPEDKSDKTVVMGGGAILGRAGTEYADDTATKGSGVSAYSSTDGQPAKQYRDNVTGAIYTDPTKCVNGCTTVVGSDPVKAPASPMPAKAEAVEAAKTKATAPAANKARKRTATKAKK